MRPFWAFMTMNPLVGWRKGTHKRNVPSDQMSRRDANKKARNRRRNKIAAASRKANR